MPGRVIPLPSDGRKAWRLFWNHTLDRLTVYLDLLKSGDLKMHNLKIDAPPNSTEMYMTRTFDAPRALVWRALSRPEHLIRWWGPHGYTNEVLEFDFRVGGKWRIRTTAPMDITFFGEYRDIVEPERITQTFAFDQLPPGVHSVETVELIEKDGQTVYQAKSVFPDVASRDGMLESGMETGVVEGFDRLDRMLEEWSARA
jgi:uncharacterized protein YndB with AHSA1/START domain